MWLNRNMKELGNMAGRDREGGGKVGSVNRVGRDRKGEREQTRLKGNRLFPLRFLLPPMSSRGWHENSSVQGGFERSEGFRDQGTSKVAWVE